MKSVLIHRIAIVMSLLLLLAGIVAYMYMRNFRISSTDTSVLYELVPSNAVTVVETDDVLAFLGEVDNGMFPVALPASDIVSFMSKSIQDFLQTLPHGLSVELSKVLLSYHQPENSKNQVLYCNMKAEDAALFYDYFASNYLNPVTEPSVMKFKGEEITTYQLADGHQLSVYLDGDLVALSFCNDLLQQVIEAQQESGTLSSNATFMDLKNTNATFAPIAVYQQINNHWKISF
ncbi:MAG: hypothetical protein K5856_07270 [Bacteroidaceae bacterium]|nr:hypothetical protein [Bacteroidaceae bacterium]